MRRPPTSPPSAASDAMADLNTDIRYIKGIGETRAKALQKLGITTLGDLLSYFPRRWEDRTLERPIRELPVGEYACVRAMLAGDPTASRIAGGRTLVKVRAVDDTGALVGGAILPGPQCSLASLVKNTAQLPQVELEAKPRRLLGTNTADCLHSGIVHGTSAMLDGMVAQFRAALHADAAPVIATGTLPYSVRDCCVTEITYRETLILDGLFAIWQRNTRR